ISLRCLAKLTHAHIFNHARAQRADGRLAYRSVPGLEVGLVGSIHPQARALHIRLTCPSLASTLMVSLPQATASAVSFFGVLQTPTSMAAAVVPWGIAGGRNSLRRV